MKHLAWLHAVPEGSKHSRLKSYKDLDENSSFLQLPDLSGAEYLVAHLNEVGMVQSTGMGVTSVTWLEIDSWLRVTGLELSTWEKLTLKVMSEVYAGELSQASKKDRPPPYTPDVSVLEVDRALVTSKIKNAFAAFRKSAEPSVVENN